MAHRRDSWNTTQTSNGSRRDSLASSNARTSDRRSSYSSTRSTSSVGSAGSGCSSGSSSSVRSCAHAGCVLAEPCRRMIELSGLVECGTKPLMILDNACGRSALATFTIFDMLPEETLEEVQIVAMDSSANAVRIATRRLEDSEWPQHVMTLKMDMQNMDGLGKQQFEYVFTNFGINLVKDVDSTLKGLRSVLKYDGTLAFTVWKRLEWIDILRTAIKEISEAPPFPDQETALLHFSNSHPWQDSTWVRAKLEEHNFAGIQIEVLPTKHRFTKAEFMENFGGCVVDYLVKNAWGAEAAVKYKEKIALALDKYLEARGEEELELELDALVVVAKKGKNDIPDSM